MIEVLGKSILETQVETLNECGIKDVSVVAGYKKEAVSVPGIKCIENSDYQSHSILNSYYYALKSVENPDIISFGDILFEASLLRNLLQQGGDIVFAVDTSWWQDKSDRDMDMVVCQTPPSDQYLSDSISKLEEIGTHLQRTSAHGEWTGLMKLSTTGAEIFKSELEKYLKKFPDESTGNEITGFINMLINKGIRIDAYFFRGHWLDIDGPEDLLLVEKIAGRRQN